MNMNPKILKQYPSENIEELILELLDKDNCLSVDTISYLLNIPSYKACKLLKKLEKWKEVTKVTSIKTTYWRKVKE